jgi:hypothetical protein
MSATIAEYSLNSFIQPITTLDKTLKIRNVNLVVMHEVNPFSVVATYVDPNYSNHVNIKLFAQDTIIVLPFPTTTDATSALTKLQSSFDLLRSYLPNIPVNIINYIDQTIIEFEINNSFTFQQMTASSTWLVTHTLNRNPAGIRITNNLFEDIEGYVRTIDNANILVCFNQSLTGYVILT